MILKLSNPVLIYCLRYTPKSINKVETEIKIFNLIVFLILFEGTNNIFTFFKVGISIGNTLNTSKVVVLFPHDKQRVTFLNCP